MLDDLFHKLHGRIILAGVFLFFGFYHDFGKHDIVRYHLYIQNFGPGSYFYLLRDVTYSGKGQFVPAFTRFNLVFSFTVRNPAYTFTLVLYSDIHQGFVGEGVCYDTFNLCGCADRGKQKQQKKDESDMSLLHILYINQSAKLTNYC